MILMGLRPVYWIYTFVCLLYFLGMYEEFSMNFPFLFCKSTYIRISRQKENNPKYSTNIVLFVCIRKIII